MAALSAKGMILLREGDVSPGWALSHSAHHHSHSGPVEANHISVELQANHITVELQVHHTTAELQAHHITVYHPRCVTSAQQAFCTPALGNSSSSTQVPLRAVVPNPIELCVSFADGQCQWPLCQVSCDP